MYDGKYRACPICRQKLSELMPKKLGNTVWEVYKCKVDGSEVWIDPFKDLRQRYGK